MKIIEQQAMTERSSPASSSSSSNHGSQHGDNESVIMDEFEYQYKEEAENNQMLQTNKLQAQQQQQQPMMSLNLETGEMQLHYNQSSTESVSTSITPPPTTKLLDTSNEGDNVKYDDDDMMGRSVGSSSASSNDGWVDVQKAIDEFGNADYNLMSTEPPPMMMMLIGENETTAPTETKDLVGEEHQTDNHTGN